MDQEIFKLISKEEDKIRLWEDLADAKGEILCKGKDEILFENLKWTKLYANGTKEFLLSNGFKPLRITLNEESNILT